jgi:hypothetical protein
MNNFKDMLKESNYNPDTNLGLLDDREETLISMAHNVHTMISELTICTQNINRSLDGDDVSVSFSEDFTEAYNSYLNYLNDL